MNEKQHERYLRHIMLSEVGEAGQKKLLTGSVLIVGTGGLGSPVAMYLAAAGIGTIGIMDADKVDLSNLQRQVIHNMESLGKDKVLSAKERMTSINPDINIIDYSERLTNDNADEIIAKYEFVIDATDNLSSKFLIADSCYKTGVPYSHAGIKEFLGQTMTVIPGQTACYRCLFDEPVPGADKPFGLFGVLPCVIGGIQATEAIKYILGIGELLINKILIYNALEMSFRKVDVAKNEHCRLCGNNK